MDGLGRVTSAAQLPTTPGHTFAWQVVWDTADNTLRTFPLELPSNVPRGLFDHMSCTLTASCVGMDGKKYTHIKSLHTEEKPDLSGVWRTMKVPLVPGGPVEECWVAPKELRDAVNNLKGLAKRPTEKRTLPECPNQSERWVVQHKLRKVRDVSEEEEVPVPVRQVASQQQEEKNAEDYAADLRAEAMVVSAEDLTMLTDEYPDTLNLLKRLCAGSAVPPLMEETADKQPRDSVALRMVAKKRKVLKDKSTAASSTQ